MSPAHPDVLPWLAQALDRQRTGDLGGALLLYRRVLSRDPGQSRAWCNLGAVLHCLGRDPEALEACARALDLEPGLAEAHATTGTVRAAGGDLDGAAAAFQAALAADPRNVPALAGLAGLLKRVDRLEEALVGERLALTLAPGNPDLILNLCLTLMRLGRLPEAEAGLLDLLAAAPGLAKARWNLAYARLLQGRWREAWPDFAARLAVPLGQENLRGFAEPAWDGAPFPGKTLLVWVEQGLGDALQFVRYLPRAKALGGRVVLLTYAGLAPLMADLEGADAVCSETGPMPAFDLQVPLLDLPALFGSTPEDLPPPTRFAPPPDHAPPPALAQALAGPGRKAGLVWAGNPAHQDDHRRSLDPANLAPLAGVAGIRWFSLQLGPGPRPALPGLTDLAPHLRTWADTAWALERLDLLVSVDTSVAHLAAGMGRETHILLPRFPDWRWGWEGAGTPWYPQAILHRQPAPGAWGEVVRGLARRLEARGGAAAPIAPESR